MTNLHFSRLTARIVGLVGLITLISCGGSSGVDPTIANPTIKITWPARTRDDGGVPAPGSAMSAHITIEGGSVSGANSEVYITRDDNTGLHTGTYPVGEPYTHAPAHFTSTFFSEANQGGSIVGIASGDINASGNNLTLINISLVNSVKSVKVIEPTSVGTGVQTQLLFEADGDGNTVIPVSQGSAKWTLVSGSGASLTDDGKLTANQAGTLVVRVKVDGITSPDKTITATQGGGSPITFEDLTSSSWKESQGHGAGGDGKAAGYYITSSNPNITHACYWVDGTFTDVHPSGKYNSMINAMSGVTAVGNFSPAGSTYHAATYAMGGYVDLAPNDNFSDALGVDGATQVGQKARKACMWNSTPESFVDLHFGGWRESYAIGVSGSNIVGYVSSVPLDSHEKAVIWSGANHTPTYLDPPGFSGSRAEAVSGNTVGGVYLYSSSHASMHACLWHGLSPTPVDLNPSFASESRLLGLKGEVAVGFYRPNNSPSSYKACLWNGTSASVIDLATVLGANYPGDSFAQSISTEPGGYQVVGYSTGKIGETPIYRTIIWHVPASALH